MKYIKLWICLGAVFSLANMAHAAGYQLNEYSAANMGRSFAGMGVVGDDFSAIGYNPAGMSINKTSGAQVGASLVAVHSDYRGTDGAGRSGRDHSLIARVMPSGFVQYKLNDNLTAGLGVYVPFGLATDYDNNWFGSRHGTLSEITNVDISPALAYRFNKYFSVGASINAQNSSARLTSASSELKGDDWGVGYTVGMTIHPLDNLRFGLSYRSKIGHQLKGHALVGGAIYRPIHAKITTPETAILSGAWDISPRWTLTGTARWTRWKRFDTLNLISPAFSIATRGMTDTISTEEKWRNTGFYALGVDCKPNQRWTFRTGIAYDMTVIRSEAHRTPRIPDGRRFWGSLGVSYTYQNMQFDVGYSHIWVVGGHAEGTDSLNLAQGARPNIKYSSDANMLSVGFQYKF
ncbi:MAG: outer membrane protein transport protein [Alphaproteobacteria bacterium]|nr:outer membrane protein transport protein [Alphaproteobacteria bacterium]